MAAAHPWRVSNAPCAVRYACSGLIFRARAALHLRPARQFRQRPQRVRNSLPWPPEQRPLVFSLIFTSECCSAATDGCSGFVDGARRTKNRDLQAAAGSPGGISNDLQAHAAFPTARPRTPLGRTVLEPLRTGRTCCQTPLGIIKYQRSITRKDLWRPSAAAENHCMAKTCAQIASIPMNSANDVSAAASSATARTMTHPPLLDRTGTVFYFCSGVKLRDPRVSFNCGGESRYD